MRRLIAVATGLTVAVVAAIAYAVAGVSAPSQAGYPHGIAAAGDSLSTGFASDGTPHDATANSWSTGSNPAVMSHYDRILARSPGIAGHSLVVARDGARVAGLAAQLEQVVRAGDIDYVTIQIGVNDLCSARSVAQITPVATFRARFAQAMAVLSQGDPDARVLVTSLADEARWNDAVLRIPGKVRDIEDGSVCDPKPGANGRQSPAVRAFIHRWEQAYDGALESVCQPLLHCRYDGGAMYRLAYTAADVSSSDAFHPSVQGLAKMAAVSWRASFDFSDHTAPSTTAVVRRGASGSTVSIAARDDRGVRGVEYRLDGSGWTVYRAPLSLRRNEKLSYRAVDIDGNISAARDVTG